MNWSATDPLSERHTEQMLQEYLVQSARDVVASGRECDPTVVREAARSVAVHCADSVRGGMDTRELHVLFSRALWGVGETTAARRMLELGVESRQIRATLLALLKARAVAPDLWPLVGAGAIRCRDPWLALDAGPVWCLDTNRIAGWEDETQLAQSLALRRILTELAPVWDATSGGGCLASRGLSGRHDYRLQARIARAWLERFALQRGWSSCPRVIRLELNG